MISATQKKQIGSGFLFAIIIFLMPYVVFGATATTTCSFTNPRSSHLSTQDAQIGIVSSFNPGSLTVGSDNALGGIAFASSTCVTVTADTVASGGSSFDNSPFMLFFGITLLLWTFYFIVWYFRGKAI